MANMRRGDDLVARVVAWHNRHPLARRISAAQVVSVGVVSFPFRAPPSGQAPRAAMVVAEAEEPADVAAGDEAPVAPAAPETPATQTTLEGGGSLRERAEARARARSDTDPRPPGPRPAARSSAAPAGIGHGSNPARQRRRGWRPAFDDDLLDPYPPKALARFALRHGVEWRPGPPEAPEREVALSRTSPRGGAVVRLWVFAAAIDLGARRVRVLVAPEGRVAVLGPRLIGRGRAGAAGAFVGAALAAAATFGTPGLGLWPKLRGPVAAPTPLAMAPVASAASASAAAGASAGPALGAVATAASAAATVPLPAPTMTPEARAPAALPVPAELPVPRPVPPPMAEPATAAAPPGTTPPAVPAPAAPEVRAQESTMRPREAPAARRRPVPDMDDSARQAARALGEMARADRARQLAERRRAAGAPPEGSAATAGQSVPPAAAQAGPAAVAPPSTFAAAPQSPPTPSVPQATPVAVGTAWAVSTRRLRTRFESEQMLAALRDVAYRNGHGSELRLEVLPAGEDWRAVVFPLATRAEAERLRDALAARGLKMEVVHF